jgi:cellulose synthase/poly-beta-1,6-N-acetylglucosamine synthase-like glycosyltransferase
MDLLQFILTILVVLSSCFIAYWGVAWWRLDRAMRMSISMTEGRDIIEPDGGWPKVSVIIPAHNEQDLIARSVEGMRAQSYPNLHFIFVLDRCTDRTEAVLREVIAEDSRFSVKSISECPDDWAGKCNAAHTGARMAIESGTDFLLFTDADVLFDPDLVRSSVALSIRENADLLSALTTLTSSSWEEIVVQPVASLNLVRMHPTDVVNRVVNPRAFANGQFMLFTRSVYELIGGHEAVSEDLLEDIAFARLVQSKGGRGIMVNSDHMLVVSMYDSLSSMQEGWKRIFIEVARRQPRRLIQWGVRSLSVGVLMPSTQCATVIAGLMVLGRGDVSGMILAMASVLLGLFMQIAVLYRFYSKAHAAKIGILGYHLGCILVGLMMLEGAYDLIRRRPIRWGGREYILEPR